MKKLTLVLAVVVMGVSLVGCKCQKCGGPAKKQAPAAKEGIRAENREAAAAAGEGSPSEKPIMIIQDAATAYGDAGYDRSRS